MPQAGDGENVPAQANAPQSWAPLRRGTTRAACVRALLAVGTEGASLDTLLRIMATQKECSATTDTPATRQYVSKVLRNDAMFIKVRHRHSPFPRARDAQRRDAPHVTHACGKESRAAALRPALSPARCQLEQARRMQTGKAAYRLEPAIIQQYMSAVHGGELPEKHRSSVDIDFLTHAHQPPAPRRKAQKAAQAVAEHEAAEARAAEEDAKLRTATSCAGGGQSARATSAALQASAARLHEARAALQRSREALEAAREKDKAGGEAEARKEQALHARRYPIDDYDLAEVRRRGMSSDTCPCEACGCNASSCATGFFRCHAMFSARRHANAKGLFARSRSLRARTRWRAR